MSHAPFGPQPLYRLIVTVGIYTSNDRLIVTVGIYTSNDRLIVTVGIYIYIRMIQ